MMGRRALFLLWLGLLLMGLVLVIFWSKQAQKIETIPYSQFQDLLRQGHVEQVVVGSDELHGDLAEPLPSGARRF